MRHGLQANARHRCNICNNVAPPVAPKLTLMFATKAAIVSSYLTLCLFFLLHELVGEYVACDAILAQRDRASREGGRLLGISPKPWH